MSRIKLGGASSTSTADDDDDDDNNDAARLSKETLAYQAQFQLPADEILVDSFNCALSKGILHQGKLYVSQHYLCFYSNILLSEARLIIRADRIESVKKESIAYIFPTGIRVVHDNAQESLFASFLSRENAFHLLEAISHGTQIGAQRVKSAKELDEDERAIRGASADGSSNGSKTSVQHVRQPSTLKSSDKHAQLLAGGRIVKSSSTDDVHDSTLAHIGSVLTEVHVSQPPRPGANAIATMHGVVVVDSAASKLPQGVKFKQAHVGTMNPHGIDGPGAIITAGETPIKRHPHNLSSSMSSNGGGMRHSPNGSLSSSPNPSPNPLSRPSSGSKQRQTAPFSSPRIGDYEDDDEDIPTAATSALKPKGRNTTGSSSPVALAMKPRVTRPNSRKPRKQESDEEEE